MSDDKHVFTGLILIIYALADSSIVVGWAYGLIPLPWYGMLLLVCLIGIMAEGVPSI